MEDPVDGKTRTTSGNGLERRKHPYLAAGWFSKLSFWWLNGLFQTARNHPLTEADIFDVLPWVEAEDNAATFERRWHTLSSEEQHRRGSLFKHLFLQFKGRLILATISICVKEMLRFAMPLLIAGLIQYLDGSGRTSQLYASVYMTLMVIFTFAMIPLETHGSVNYLYVAMAIRATCSALIYKKVLTLSTRSRSRFPTGHIVTLMSTDVETFHACLQSLFAVIVSPLLCIAFIAFEAKENGISVIVGVSCMVLFILLRLWIAKHIAAFRSVQEGLTDKRVHLMNEIISAMRVIKMYCWEKPFAQRARKCRRDESRANLKRSLMMTIGFSSSFTMGNLIVYVMIMTRFLLGDEIAPETTVRLVGWIKTLEIAVLFVLPHTFGVTLEALGASERIKRFLMCEEFVQDPLLSVDTPADADVTLTGVHATWDEEDSNKEKKASEVLKDINFSFQQKLTGILEGDLVGVTGKVGCGKSSLLMAILGELQVSSGKRCVRGSIAYVPQEAWVLSQTIRKNVILDMEFDEQKYDTILKACALDEDIHQFSKRDMTLVGERGLCLSGGQKARLGLARAMYQDADIYLLDDPLAAVDDKVGLQMFNKCICGFLEGKLRILVTHHLQYLPMVDKVVVMEEGDIVLTGKHSDISEQIQQYVDIGKPDTTKTDHYSNLGSLSKDIGNSHQSPDVPEANIKMTALGSKEFEMEGDAPLHGVLQVKEEGGVAMRVYLQYLRAGHGKVLAPLVLIFLGLYRTAEIACEWMFSQWHWPPDFTLVNKTYVDTIASKDHGTWFLTSLGLLTLCGIAFGLLFSVFITCLTVNSARTLYNRMFEVVLRAPMYFFETNPVGQILNRFSRDSGFMDIYLIFPAYLMCQYVGAAVVYTLYACVTFPWMILVAAFLIFALGFLVRYTLLCIRDVKRIESSRRSPTYSHLAATLQGLPVIRAFRKQPYFLSQAYSYIDTHTAAWYLYLTTQRFLGVRIDFLATVFSVMYMLVTVLTSTPDPSGAATTGLSMVYLLYLLGTLQFGFQMVAETETTMTSVERILQFSHLEQEAPGHTDLKPPPGWPLEGALTLTDVCLTYRGQTKPALGPISINIKPAEKLFSIFHPGWCSGRTGAGKSSLFVSLLRMVEPTGSMTIDGLEVTKVGLTDLRSRISVIPQDPILFSGSLRFNLDPFEKFDDEQVWKALKQVSKLSAGLSTEMGEAGGNFSVGEKQLLCMARALMRRHRIIVVDEATANVDNRTDAIIQRTLSTEFSGSTVLTIAHRLNTVINYDKIMVLSDGCIVEYDHPLTLQQDSSSLFYQMVQQSGQDTSLRLHEPTMVHDMFAKSEATEDNCETKVLQVNT